MHEYNCGKGLKEQFLKKYEVNAVVDLEHERINLEQLSFFSSLESKEMLIEQNFFLCIS